MALDRRRNHVLHLLLHRTSPRNPPSCRYYLISVHAGYNIKNACMGELKIDRVSGNGEIKGSLTGIAVGKITQTQKIFRSLQAFGDIAFAYSYSIILIEIQVIVFFYCYSGEVRRYGFSFIYIGYGEITTVRDEDDEEGHDGERSGDNCVLHGMWLHGLRCIRRQISRESSNWVRILQPVLAPRHRKHRDCHPPRRSVPGVLPAFICVHREMGFSAMAEIGIRDEGNRNSDLIPTKKLNQHQSFPTDLANGVCDSHNYNLHASSFLQRCGRTVGRT